MGLFRKKPVVIEAIQWFKNGDHPAVRLYEGQQGTIKGFGQYGWIDTLEGGHIVTPGDWIIKGVQGEFYPCKPDIFAATYEDAALPPDTTSDDSMQLAQMVMSDCGISSAATDRLQTRVAERIQRHIDGLQPEPVGVPDGLLDPEDWAALREAAEIGQLAAAPQPDEGCGACGDACNGRGSCRLDDESPKAGPVHDFAALIHYPDHWDTAAYPTLDSAIAEVMGCVGCSECKPEQPARDDDMVLIRRGLLGAACSAIDKKRDAPTVLELLREVTMGRAYYPLTDQQPKQPALTDELVDLIREAANALDDLTPCQTPETSAAREIAQELRRSIEVEQS